MATTEPAFDNWAGIQASLLNASIPPAYLSLASAADAYSLPVSYSAVSGATPDPTLPNHPGSYNQPRPQLNHQFQTPSFLTRKILRRRSSPADRPAVKPLPPSHREDPAGVVARERYLERNRVAASKCRRKKKRETDQLKDHYQRESHRKQELEGEVKHLHTELLDLKDQLLRHSRCDDEYIQLYLGQMAHTATVPDTLSSGGSDRSASLSSVEAVPSSVERGIPGPPPPTMPGFEFDPSSQIIPGEAPDTMGLTGEFLCSQPALGNIFDQVMRIP